MAVQLQEQLLQLAWSSRKIPIKRQGCNDLFHVYSITTTRAAAGRLVLDQRYHRQKDGLECILNFGLHLSLLSQK